MKRSATLTIAAAMFALGISQLPYRTYAQQLQRLPHQLPQIPQNPGPYQPQPNYPQPQPNYPQQQPYYPQQQPYYPQQQPYYPQQQPYYPQLGSNCYAGQVIGSLYQAAPIGAQCTVYAYGVGYSGVVGQ